MESPSPEQRGAVECDQPEREPFPKQSRAEESISIKGSFYIFVISDRLPSHFPTRRSDGPSVFYWPKLTEGVLLVLGSIPVLWLPCQKDA